MKGKKETSQIAPPGRYGRHYFCCYPLARLSQSG